jgi:cation transport ATPase
MLEWSSLSEQAIGSVLYSDIAMSNMLIILLLILLNSVLCMQVWMVTGDNGRTARSLARTLGIHPEHVAAEVMPAHKARKVSSVLCSDTIRNIRVQR